MTAFAISSDSRGDFHRGGTRVAALAAALLAVALVLGGGGSPAPGTELLVQLMFAGTLAVWFGVSGGDALAQVPRRVRLIAALVAGLPLLQLVPLPPFIWHALPGREVMREALALVGAENSWRPVSVAPARTFAAFLAVLPPLAILALTAATPARQRWWIPAAIATFGAATMLLGAAQLSGGRGGALRFYVPDSVFLDGFQANHNSTADILLIAIVAAAAVIGARAERGRLPGGNRMVLPFAAGAAALLAMGVVLTISRTGIGLLPAALLGTVLVLAPWLHLSARRLAIGGAAVAVLAVIAALLLGANLVVGQVIARFNFTGELRPELWADSLFAARQYFPFGSGSGTFTQAMIAVERLEVIRQTVPNRAHNDFLELLLETGIAGPIALSVISSILFGAAWRGLRGRSAEGKGLVVFGCAALVILALHSLVDYPIRSMALACVAAACAGLLFPAPAGKTRVAPPAAPEE